MYIHVVCLFIYVYVYICIYNLISNSLAKETECERIGERYKVFLLQLI